MAEDNGTGEERQEFPGLDLAYGMVQSSYDSVVNRLNAVESRIQAVMVFSVSFLLTAPLLVASSGVDITLASLPSYTAAALAGVNLIVGTVMRTWGDINLLGFHEVRNYWLELTDDEFKLEAVRWAAEHYQRNTKTVNCKGHAVSGMTVILLLEAASLTYWGLSQITQ